MPASSSVPRSASPAGSEAAIVAELRAAGCVFAEDEAQLLVAEARTPAELAAMVAQRVSGLPLEQVLGWAEFCGLRIAIRPDIFVPRRRTEFLVREAIALSRPGIVVLDLCCGQGVMLRPLLLAGAGPITAVDASPRLVAAARQLTGTAK